jgi:hypothetical protein
MMRHRGNLTVKKYKLSTLVGMLNVLRIVSSVLLSLQKRPTMLINQNGISQNIENSIKILPSEISPNQDRLNPSKLSTIEIMIKGFVIYTFESFIWIKR